MHITTSFIYQTKETYAGQKITKNYKKFSGTAVPVKKVPLYKRTLVLISSAYYQQKIFKIRQK